MESSVSQSVSPSRLRDTRDIAYREYNPYVDYVSGRCDSQAGECNSEFYLAPVHVTHRSSSIGSERERATSRDAVRPERVKVLAFLRTVPGEGELIVSHDDARFPEVSTRALNLSFTLAFLCRFNGCGGSRRDARRRLRHEGAQRENGRRGHLQDVQRFAGQLSNPPD